MDRYGLERQISEILNESYGANATGPLDRMTSNKIIALILNLGWASSEEIAYLVDAAGGEIRVPEKALHLDPPPLLRYRNDANDELVFQTKPVELRNPSPAERESGESRTVHSGPIKVKPTPSGGAAYASSGEAEKEVSDS